MKSFPTFSRKILKRLVFLIAIFLQMALFLVKFQTATAQAQENDLIVRSCEHIVTPDSDMLNLRLSAIASDGTVQPFTADNLTVTTGEDALALPTTPTTSKVSTLKNHLVVVYENTSSMPIGNLNPKLIAPAFVNGLFANGRSVSLLTFDNNPKEVVLIGAQDGWSESIPTQANEIGAGSSRMDLAIKKALESQDKEPIDVLLITDSAYPTNNNRVTDDQLISLAQKQNASISAIIFHTGGDSGPAYSTLANMAKETGGYVWYKPGRNDVSQIAADVEVYLASFLDVINDLQVVVIDLIGVQFIGNPRLDITVTVGDQVFTQTIDADCSNELSLDFNRQEGIEIVLQDASFLPPDLPTDGIAFLYSKDGGASGVTIYPDELDDNKLIIPFNPDTANHAIHVSVQYPLGTILAEVDGRLPMATVITSTATVAPTAEKTPEANVDVAGQSIPNDAPYPSPIISPFVLVLILVVVDIGLFFQVRTARVRYLITHPDNHDLGTMNVTIKNGNSIADLPRSLTKKTMFIGRSPENDIQLKDDNQKISRQHGVIMWRNHTWYYSNLKSEQVVYVDDKKVVGLRLVKIQEYAPIKIGDTVLMFHKGMSSLKPPDMLKTNLPT